MAWQRGWLTSGALGDCAVSKANVKHTKSPGSLTASERVLRYDSELRGAGLYAHLLRDKLSEAEAEKSLLKNETARLRANFADLMYSISEPLNA